MPPLYIATHLLLSLGCLLVVLRLPPGSRQSRLFCLAVWLLVAAGFLLERRAVWGWALMRLTTSDLPFLTNLTLEGAAMLAGLLWRAAADGDARRRALVLAIVLTGVALLSYRWYFEPVPAGLTGKADASGYCAQTTEDSCSASAAVMLLSRKGIPVDEAEMAALCLTRAGKGTPDLGLLRGLTRKAAPYGWRVRLVTSSPAQLHTLEGPVVIAVGLGWTAPAALVRKMSEFGWERGRFHSVVVMGGDPAGRWLDVADPSYGREKWPAEHLADLWNGQGFVLSR